MTTPIIDRRAIWRRLMDRAAASQRTPTIHEPAGYEFQASMTPELVEMLPQEAQTELALQLSKLVLDTSRVTKRRIIEPPAPIDTAKARQGLSKLTKVGRYGSRQGPAISLAIREGALTLPPVGKFGLKGARMVELTDAEFVTSPICGCCSTPVADPATMLRLGDEVICPVCAESETTICPSCHKPEYWWMLRRGPTEPICRVCSDRLMTRCPSCDELTPRGTVRNGTCPICVRSRYIQQYNFKPTPLFFTNPVDPNVSVPMATVPCMGVELETELPRSIRDTAAHAYDVTRGIEDLIYAKHDGSLDYGVEYVSHPFSWEWLRGGGGARWVGFLEKLRASKHTSYDPGSCGMHVHVSRKFFTGDPLYRLLNLAHNTPQLFLQLSRRNESSLVQWANPRGGNPPTFRRIADGFDQSPTKYTAINVTRHTIEFRLFRGTLNTTGFFANLEATKALLDFCSTPNPALTAAGFTAFANTNEAKYPNFVGAILRSTVKA